MKTFKLSKQIQIIIGGGIKKMRDGILHKGLVVGIILVFVGTSVSGTSVQAKVPQKTISSFEFIKTCTETSGVSFQNPNDAGGNRLGYKLLIIAPSVFSAELQKLVTHKNNVGVPTTLVTTETIYQTYPGTDKAEQIKYCIKDTYDQYAIDYVLLVGGLKGFFKNPNNEDNWYVPARYSHLDLDGYPEAMYLSDLYFADIYWKNTTDFCNWNDHDPFEGMFGEWRWEGGQEVKDARDLVPDIAIGRWACRNLQQVKTMVDKTITYESSNHTNESWFLRFLMLGGENANDTSPGYNGVIEGKYANQMAFNWAKKRHPFIPIGLWPSEEDISKTNLTKEKFNTEQHQGSGFTYMSGHGDPGSWYAHQYYTGFHNWTFIRWWSSLRKLENGDNLPVAIIGGCNTACFDKPLRQATTYLSIDCFSWLYTCLPKGGSIATIGNTNIGYSLSGKAFTTDYGGYLQTHFFEVYGNGTDILGDIWKQEITDYVKRSDAAEDMLHCKIAESWLLLGDPSLKIGGY